MPPAPVPEVRADERGGYRNDRAMMLDAVAKIDIELGRHEEALNQAERAFAMVKGRGRRWIRAGILTTVAAAHRKLADLDRSLLAGRQALVLAREARFVRTEADSLLGLSLTFKRLGRHDEARALVALGRALHKTEDAAAGPAWQQASAIFSDVGVPVEEYRDPDR